MKKTAYNSSFPNVIVLLAAYNGIKWIEEQVNTILSQEDVNVSLVVSVDKSTDGTEAWFSNLANNDDRITLIPPARLGKAAAANFFHLISAADYKNADYIAFADQDDIWFSDKLKCAIEKIEQLDVNAYSGNVIAFWENGKTRLVNKAQPQRQWDFLFEAAGPGCTYVFTKICYQKLHSFITSHRRQLVTVERHDWFCYAFVRSRGFSWFIDPTPKMLYRQHDQNHIGVNFGIKAAIVRLKLLTNGWWMEQVRTMAVALELQDEAFVKSFVSVDQRRSVFYLLRNVFSCRRSRLDSFYLGCILLFLLIFKN